MLLQDFPSWEQKSHKLTLEEAENPMQVIHSFFDYAHLPEIREQLWEFLKATVTGNYCKIMSRRERSDMLYFYERLEKLIEAVHLISLERKEE